MGERKSEDCWTNGHVWRCKWHCNLYVEIMSMDTVLLMCDWIVGMLMTYTSVAHDVFGQRSNRMMCV